jgi:hypothetical protein
MIRLLFEDDGRLRRRRESAAAANGEASQSRSGVAFDFESGAVGVRRRREDAAGRRGLTGVEFRRRRPR